MFKNFLNRIQEPQFQSEADENLFDEAFLRRMERLSFRSARMLRGGMMGERPSRKLRPSLDFSDHRPYASGDDFRYVDWQAYARHEELFVKMGEATQRINIHILLDASHSMDWAPSRSYAKTSSKSTRLRRFKANKWRKARRLAGALAYLGLAAGERVSITPFVHTLGDSFGPTIGKRQVNPMLQYLTGLHPPAEHDGYTGEGGLTHSMSMYARQNTSGGLLVVISDLIDTLGDDDIVDSAQAVAEGLRYLLPPRWQVLVMHLLAAEELRPSILGDFDMEDAETMENIPIHVDSSLLTAYHQRMDRWCAEIQAACSRRSAAYSRIQAEWPVEKKVMPYLRQQGLLQ